MRNTTTIGLLLVALVLGTVGAGVVSAGTNDAQTGNSWYGWMTDHMRFGRGYGYGMIGAAPGFCGGYGSYAPVVSDISNRGLDMYAALLIPYVDLRLLVILAIGGWTCMQLC